jgi:hypothetical protein
VGDTWAELWDRIDGGHAPIAATLPDAAELLGASLAAVELAAREVEPYLCGDGITRKWSIGELADRLGLADHNGKGYRRSWRTGDRHGDRGRRHARRGAAATNGHRADPEPIEDWAQDRAAGVEDLADPDDLAGVEDLAAHDGRSGRARRGAGRERSQSRRRRMR